MSGPPVVDPLIGDCECDTTLGVRYRGGDCEDKDQQRTAEKQTRNKWPKSDVRWPHVHNATGLHSVDIGITYKNDRDEGYDGIFVRSVGGAYLN